MSEENSPKDSANIVVFPEQQKSDEADNATVITEHSIKHEPNTLVEQDKEQIVIVEYNIKELTRLFRSLSTLSPVQIRLLEIRYINLLIFYESRLPKVDTFYHVSRLFISIGGVAVPALLSIQSPTGINSVGLYWFTWMISLLVTLCHNVSTMFRFDKKYFGIHATFERLKTEGMQYLELSGHYSGHHGHGPPTHENQYIYFVNSVERIRQRQIEDEYSAARESEKVVPVTTHPAKFCAQMEQVVPSPMDLTLNRALEKK
jgi:hypothetical protein